MISILIRNKNEEVALDNALKSILRQQFNVPYEIIIVDDHSTDNSVAVATNYGCKVVMLDKKFTYGYALNFGVLHCQYEIILLLSSHNILLSNNIPSMLINYFNDSSIAAVRLTPVANSKQIEQSLRSCLIIKSSNYNHQKDWNNLIIANCSAIRKSIAIEIPFNEEIRSNEEKLWSLDVIKKGYTIVSNIPCYFIYNKKNKDSVVVRDYISKFQIDGLKIKTFDKVIFNFFKSIPWAIQIAFKTWFQNNRLNIKFFLIPFKYKKGLYK